MSQHDYIIANDTGANVRSDLNNALAAIASNNSGSTEPTTTYAFQFWYDTTNNLLKLRNSANSAWITLPFDPTTSGEVNITANSTATADLAFSGGDVTFGDNDKAIFGAGSDLQIYHDGSNSYIAEVGAGNLRVQGTNNVYLQVSSDGGTTWENAVLCDADGAVTLRYNNSNKLATTGTGIDVTGTVTADGLTVDGVIDITSTTSLSANIQNTGGSALLPTYSFNGSADVGMYCPAINTLAFATAQIKRQHIANNGDISFYEDTGTTAKFFWDASAESLGIGTSSPRTSLDIRGTSNTSASTIQIVGTSVSSLLLGQNADGGVIRGQGGNNALTFWTGGSGDTGAGLSGSERMRIDSSGHLLMGTTSNYTVGSKIQLKQDNLSYSNLNSWHSATSGTRYHFEFRDNSNAGSRGSITTNGSSTSYNTTSDYRLKTDVQPMTGATERLKSLKPVNFEWIADGTRVDGFIAHEAQEVVPEAVTGTKDAVQVWKEGEELPEGVAVGDNKLDENGNTIPDYQGIDQSKLTPLLTAALQEAVAKIEQLESRLAAAGIA